jgi:lipopolysaccharide/colanic/teichoic acid biosynthesis glycosyltransferase
MTTRTLAAISAFTVLWLAGNSIYFRSGLIWGTPVEQQAHLAIVLALSVSVVFRSATVRGSFQDRLREAVVSTAVMFGAYALVIIFGRLYFTRSILATVIPITLAISLLVIWLRNRRDGVKAVVVAPLVKAVPESLGKVDAVADPSTDFRPYDLILVDLHAPVSAEWAAALSRGMLCGCRIRHIEEHLEELCGAVSIAHFELEHLPSTDHASYIQIKRLIDIVGVLILAPIAALLVMLAAVAIVLSSGWPAFFIRPRVGLGGSHFNMWKLRTMRPASPEEGEKEAVPGDARVTAIGRLLRRARIDELPQLWNVLKGDMSLIGPRPEAVAFHESYVAVEPKFAYRCFVRPGITGWAQVNAPPSTNADEAVYKARFDLYYIKRQSLSLDVQIGIRTLWTIVHGGGAR